MAAAAAEAAAAEEVAAAAKVAAAAEAATAAEVAAADEVVAAAESAQAAARKLMAEQGIVRVHVKKVESHGKAGATDGEGNKPGFILKAALESGALVHPGTRELVLYLAYTLPMPVGRPRWPRR